MKIERLALDGVLLIKPKKIGDARGFFSETFRSDRFEAEAGPIRFVQENQSLSAKRGTVRGLHYQRAPRGQAKLVRVLRGSILDVVVDARTSSPTFGQHLTIEISEENWCQIFIPEGFLHGFCTLTDAAEVSYKVTEYYSPEHEAGIRWDDPALEIRWPTSRDDATVSEKDRTAPAFSEIFPPP